LAIGYDKAERFSFRSEEAAIDSGEGARACAFCTAPFGIRAAGLVGDVEGVVTPIKAHDGESDCGGRDGLARERMTGNLGCWRWGENRDRTAFDDVGKIARRGGGNSWLRRKESRGSATGKKGSAEESGPSDNLHRESKLDLGCDARPTS